MGCEGCFRIVLVIINIIFLIVGLGLTAGGVILRFFPSVYEPYLDDLEGQIPDFTAAVGIEGITTPSSEDQSLDLGSVFDSVGIGLLVFGIFVTLIALFGMIGACCKVKFMLIIYVIVVLVLFVSKLALFIVLLTGHFTNQIKDEINKIIDNDYGGITDFGIKSLSLNYVMLDYACCGVDSYEDFDNSVNWDKTWSVTYSNTTVDRTMQIPLACCKIDGTFPTSFTPVDTNCTFEATDDNSNWKTGCWDELNSEYKKQQNTVIGIFVAVLVFELICAIFAIVILCKDKQDDGQFV